MAKTYAKKFYTSRRWIRCASAYLASVNHMCERCGEPAAVVHHKVHISPANIDDPEITLNWNNLEALCLDCHNKEHYRSPSTADGLTFDGDGNLVKAGTD